SLSARSARLTAQAAADLGEQSLEVREVLAAATVAPELATMLLETVFGGQLEAPARVDRPARFTLAMQPVTIALGDGLAPDWGRTGEASVRAGLEGQLIASNIVLAATPEQPARQIGALGLQDFNLTLQFPLASLAPGSPPAEARFELGGIVLGSPQQRLMEVRSRGQGSVAGGRPVGPLTAESRVEIADVWGVDRILGQEGRLAQAVG